MNSGAWKRFEKAVDTVVKAVDTVVKAGPQHRTKEKSSSHQSSLISTGRVLQPEPPPRVSVQSLDRSVRSACALDEALSDEASLSLKPATQSVAANRIAPRRDRAWTAQSKEAFPSSSSPRECDAS